MEQTVNTLPALVPCADYQPETVRRALEQAIRAAGGLDWVRPGMRIGLKLNLCAAMKPEEAATTHPVMAAELTKMLVQRGAVVVAGDSPGAPFTATIMNGVYNAAGMKRVEEAGGELNRNFDHHTVDFPEAKTARRFEYCTWLSGCDAVINFSKLKSHGLMGMTGAAKNLYGVVPGLTKPEYHYRYPDPMAFANMLVDLNEYVKPRLCLCDAVEIMEGNGPTKGTPRRLGLLLAGRDPYALDRLAAHILGLREEENLILTAAIGRGLLPEKAEGPLCAVTDPAPYRLEDFVRSGATTGWFVRSPDDPLFQRIKKKALYLLLRSRPALREGCTGCGACGRICPAKAIRIVDKKAVIDRKKCVRCFCCQEFCPAGAMQVQRSPVARLINR